MKHYEITIKEVGRPNPLKTSLSGNKTRQQVIEWFGLENPDVEWYTIEEKED